MPAFPYSAPLMCRENGLSWKIVLMLVCAFVALAGLADFHKRAADADAAEFLRAQPVEPRRMHNPPVERDIIALAERDGASFCYPADRSADGCDFSAVLFDDEWTVFARPYTGSPERGYFCCVVDSTHLFIYSRKGVFLRQMHGGP